MCDQFSIATRLTEAGLARTVPLTSRSASAVRAEATTLLHDPHYAAASSSMRAEISSMPSPATVAAALADLARARPSIPAARDHVRAPAVWPRS